MSCSLLMLDLNQDFLQELLKIHIDRGKNLETVSFFEVPYWLLMNTRAPKFKRRLSLEPST